MRSAVAASLCALALLGARSGQAQEAPEPLEVGTPAPDFDLEGATRTGVMVDPVRLSDFRGKTVVLAFFYRARTPG